MRRNASTNRNWLAVIALTALVSACGGGGGAPAATAGGTSSSGWLISRDDVVDGGPGRDGIPSIDSPAFEPISGNTSVRDDDLVVAIQTDTGVRVYPHDILDWHEIVNDFSAPSADPFVLSYCPLTGSAMAWQSDGGAQDPTYGVSGLLFNSNLILYDRDTASFWVQMMEVAVNGDRINEQPNRLRLIETTKQTIRDRYPNASILTRDTGYLRDYDDYPYGSYKRDAALIFPVDHSDPRLHAKTRVLGVKIGNQVKAYNLADFGNTIGVIQDQVGGRSIVVAGHSADNYAVAYDRELADGTILDFAPYAGADPTLVLQDTEGNTWDIWGTAISGPRAGTQLRDINAYVAYWFAWVAFFPQVEIY